MAVRTDADGEDYTRALALGTQANLTVCGWFRLVVDRNTWSTIFSVDNGTGDNWLLQTNSDGVTLNSVFDATSQEGIGAMTVGTWYFIAMATAGTSGNIYYRTAAQSTLTTVAVTGATASVNAATLRIGESPWGTEWWNGEFSNVCMWTATLTAAEVLQESTRFVPYRYANLVAWYPLIRPETVDYSGNGRTLSGGAGATYADGPPIPWYTTSKPRLVLPPATGGAINVTLNRATESDAGRGLVVAKNVPLSRASESDTGRLLTPSHNVILPRAAVTDLARNLTPSKVVNFGRSIETDIARPLGAGSPIQVTLGRAVETDTVKTLTPSKLIGFSRAIEADIAQLLSRAHMVPLNRASEVDAGRLLTIQHSIFLGRAVENDIAQVVSPSSFQTVVLGRATETSVARGLTRTKMVALTRAIEADVARQIRVGYTITLGRAVEVDAARTLQASRYVVLQRASEVDAARSLDIDKVVHLLRAVETDLAFALAPPDTARPVSGQGAEEVIIRSVTGQAVSLVKSSSGIVIVTIASGYGERI